jgi:predicted lipoprotein with Yx(FWY)xxD motif
MAQEPSHRGSPQRLEEEMHTMRTASCAIVIVTMVAACSAGHRGADTASSAGMIGGDSLGASTPATATTASPAVKTATNDDVGRYITDAHGRALYMFKRDTRNTSTCTATDGCTIAWPPFSGSTPTSADASVQTPMLGAINRTDGGMQVTYHGKPLYYYDDDKKAGDTEGQGKLEFGGLWYLVSPKGQEITRGGKKPD